MIVYTVILNDHDNLRPPHVVEPGVEYICFSDEYHDCPPWRIVPAPRVFDIPGKNSRIPKILGHLFFDEEVTIYHDASLQMTKPPSALVAEDLGVADLALYRHPCRHSVVDEMAVCRSEGIGYDLAMRAQVERYADFNLTGLWAGGVLIRRHTERVRRFNEIWWREFHNGCSRDQIALPWAIHESGIKPAVIDANILEDSSRFDLTFHADWTEHKDNAAFSAQRALRADRRHLLRGLCR